MNWNSLRGVVADKVMDGLLDSLVLRDIQLANNLFGISYDDK